MKTFKGTESDIFGDITNQLHHNLNAQIDEVITEGLRRKGFEFENRLDLEEFIKERCKAVENQEFKQKIFYVDETPFLLWIYEQKISPIYNDKNGNISISAEAGSYKFI